MNECTMIHVKFPDCLDLLKYLYQQTLLDCFYVKIRPPFTSCDSEDNGVRKTSDGHTLCIEFAFASDIEKDRLKLWKTLNDYGIRIVWKKLDKGYEIDGTGKILKSWDLDDGMC